MSVEVVRTGRLSIAPKAVARFIASQAIGRIKRRIARSRDVRDRPFAPYSASYRRALVEGGRRTRVKLSLTGGLLRAIHVVREQVSRTHVLVVLGFRPTSSQQVRLRGGRARRSKSRYGPPHPRLASWLHHGTQHMPARPFFGLSPADRRLILRQLARWNGAIVKARGLARPMRFGF